MSDRPPLPVAVTEQTKLLATWLNNLGSNLIIVGFAAPLASFMVGLTQWSAPASFVMVVYAVAGVLLHRAGDFVLGGLR